MATLQQNELNNATTHEEKTLQPDLLPDKFKREEGIDIEMEASDLASDDVIVDRVDIVSLLRSCVQAAVARIDDESWRSSRSTRRIELMLSLLPDGRSDGTGKSGAQFILITSLL